MDAKDRRIAEQDKRIAELEAQLKAALEKIAQLEKNSSNSSKPPSSDIVKPPQNKDRRRKKKIGAQKGHKQHLREPCVIVAAVANRWMRWLFRQMIVAKPLDAIGRRFLRLMAGSESVMARLVKH